MPEVVPHEPVRRPSPGNQKARDISSFLPISRWKLRLPYRMTSFSPPALNGLAQSEADRCRSGAAWQKEFGICDDCGEPIPYKRLNVVLWATYCVPRQDRPTRRASRGRDPRGDCVTVRMRYRASDSALLVNTKRDRQTARVKVAESRAQPLDPCVPKTLHNSQVAPQPSEHMSAVDGPPIRNGFQEY